MGPLEGGSWDLACGKSDPIPDEKNLAPAKKELAAVRKDLIRLQSDLTFHRKELTPAKRNLLFRENDLTPAKRDLTSGRKDHGFAQKDLIPRKKDLTFSKSKILFAPPDIEKHENAHVFGLFDQVIVETGEMASFSRLSIFCQKHRLLRDSAEQHKKAFPTRARAATARSRCAPSASRRCFPS